jgi:drug/metabolite transporter (DMT)-like permease
MGLVAIILAPLWMVIGFYIWDNHWAGSAFALNVFKCNLASIGFLAVVLATNLSGYSETVWRFQNAGFLMLSSTIGIIVGDWTWLEGMRILGARDIIVMDCLKPFVAALMGKLFLGEHLHMAAYFGLLLTIGGVTVVGWEKEAASDDEHRDIDNGVELENDSSLTTTAINTEHDNLLPKAADANKLHKPSYKHQESYAEQRRNQKQSCGKYLYGLINGFLNILLHAVGSTITKAYGRGMTTWDINLVRFGFAGVCMGLLSSSMTVWTRFHCSEHSRKCKYTSPSLSSSNLPWYAMPSMPTVSWIHVCFGVMFVTFLHPLLVNYAMFQIPLALLLTLDSIGPLYSLPMGWLMQNERPTIKACFGAVLSVGGIVILAFKGMTEAADEE